MLPHQRFTRVWPYRLIVVLLATAFLAELGEAFLLPAILPNRFSESIQAGIDALLLALILAPTFWWLMIQLLRDEHEKAESRFHNLVESSPDGILTVDRSGLIRLVNGRMEEMFGYSRTELVGRPVEMLVPGTARARHVADRTEFNGQPRLRPMGTGLDLRALRKDGSEFPVDVSLSPVPRGGEPLVIAIVRDVTKRQEAERALRESEQRYRGVVQHIDEIVYAVEITTDPSAGRVLFVSDRVERVTGHTSQEFTENPQLWSSLVHPDDVSSVASLTNRLLSERTSVTRLYRLRDDRTGHYLWIEDRVAPYVARDGALVTLFGVARDVTERRRAEEELQETASLLRTVLNNAPITIFATDSHGVFTLSEGKGLEHVGLKPGENVGVSALDLYGSLSFVEQTGKVITGKDVVRRVLAGETVSASVELRGIYFEQQLVPLRGTDGKVIGIVGVATDITERKRAEIALRDSEERLRLITDNVLDLVSQVGLDGTYVYVSLSYQRVLGYSPRSLLGTSAFELVHPEDLERVRAVFDEAVQRRVSGRSDVRCRHRDGHYVWLEVVGTLLLDQTGTPNGAILSARDITERRRASDALGNAHTRLQSLSRRLLTIQETERRSLARELHDEIGQALTATKINLQALERFPDPATLASRLRDANSIVERALEQVRSLSLELRPPLLDDLGLPAALRWLLDQHARRSGLRVQFASDPFEGRLAAEVETAGFRIVQQGLTNIEKHAGARTVTVELHRVGDALHLHVRDDGTGFDVPAAHARAVHGGSLGLLSMEERAALAGGGIEWTSAPGRGTDVHAWLTLAPTTRP